MNFSEQPPSKQWLALKYRGEKFAEVWFKPEGEPLALAFRIPRERFQSTSMVQLLTTENLLKAVGIATEEVESWRHGDVSHSGMNGTNPELGQCFASPPEDISHLIIHISLKQPTPVVAPDECAEAPTPVVAPDEGAEAETPGKKWQDMKARWNTILGVEATIDTLRLTLEGLQVQMDNASKKTLTTEEKLHALNADVAQWTKAKSRVHHTAPKVREFVHRATWAMGAPERKKLEELEELIKNDVRPDVSVSEMNKLAEQLENLLKDRQVLAAQGVNVHQECKNVSANIDAALRTLQNNAAVRADKSRHAARPKGKFFKHIRKWSGAD